MQDFRYTLSVAQPRVSTFSRVYMILHDLTASLKAQAARCRIQRWDSTQILSSCWQIGLGCRRPITGAVLVVCIMWCLCCHMSSGDDHSVVLFCSRFDVSEGTAKLHGLELE